MKLKKLQLRKTEIANLNDDQMFGIQGGSSAPCGYISAVTAVTALTVETYNLGKENSAWTCDDPYKTVSEAFVDGACLLPEVNVYSVYTG